MLNRLTKWSVKTDTSGVTDSPVVPYFVNRGIPDGPDPCPHCTRDMRDVGRQHRCLKGRCPNGPDHSLGLVTASEASNKVIRKNSSFFVQRGGRRASLPQQMTGVLLKKPSKGFMRVSPPPGLSELPRPKPESEGIETAVPLLQCAICLKKEKNGDAVMELCDKCPFRICSGCKTQMDQFPTREELERMEVEFFRDFFEEIFAADSPDGFRFEATLITFLKYAYLYDASVFYFLIKLLNDDLVPFLKGEKKGARRILSVTIVWACWGPEVADMELAERRLEFFEALLRSKYGDPTYNNNAAIIVACANGRLPHVKRLVQCKGVNANAHEGKALQAAAANNHEEVVQFLLKSKLVKSKYGLENAITQGSLSLAGQLLYERESKKKSRELYESAKKRLSGNQGSKSRSAEKAIEVIWESIQTGRKPEKATASKPKHVVSERPAPQQIDPEYSRPLFRAATNPEMMSSSRREQFGQRPHFKFSPAGATVQEDDLQASFLGGQELVSNSTNSKGKKKKKKGFFG